MKFDAQREVRPSQATEQWFLDDRVSGPQNSGMNALNASMNISPSLGSRMDKSRTSSAITPLRNVTYGVNYLLASVHSFVQATSSRESRAATTPPRSASSQTSRPPSPDENCKHHVNRDQATSGDLLEDRKTKRTASSSTTSIVGSAKTNTTSTKRSSQRDRTPREKPKEKSRVRYDMNVVPVVARNDDFLAFYRQHDDDVSKRVSLTKSKSTPRRMLPKRRCRDATPPEKNISEKVAASSGKRPCLPRVTMPFREDKSVVWIPQTRREWEDCLTEMTAVCTSAALRRHVASGSDKPFFPPLSQAYIRDRLDIDDPLNGYQIRHKEGGWLQGFILFTTFTTWSHYFKWDTQHEQSGVDVEQDVARGWQVDRQGSLSAELEAQPRSGDPMAGGVICSTIAEIGLLGGLGCGEILLRMALDGISQQGYKFVVLQATDASKSFYERFGFVRVGAVSSYGIVDTSRPRATYTHPVAQSDVVGYRHWTYANETKRNLDKHGGPSYMMALRLDSQDMITESLARPSFLVDMKAFAVEEKPKIVSLGNTTMTNASNRQSWTPMPKSVGQCSVLTAKRMEPTKPHHGLKRQWSRASSSVDECTSTRATESTHHRSKRRRTNASPINPPREDLLKPPPPGKSLTFAQKQYQSPWLAVPPTKSESNYRRPPRERVYEPNSVASTRVKRRGPGSLPTDLNSTQSSGKKKRGRPPKAKRSSPPILESRSQRAPASSTARGRGRPRKVSVASLSHEPYACQSLPSHSGKNRGRPPKAKAGAANSKDVAYRALQPIVGKNSLPPLNNETRKQDAPGRLGPGSNQPYLFNRIVKPKHRETEPKYYFVFHFDPESPTMYVVPMKQSGTLFGAHGGRPRWKVGIESADQNVRAVSVSDFQLVSAKPISKTSIIGGESWDIQE